MITRVSKDLCIGCELCPNLAPELYHMDDDGKASAIREEIGGDYADKAREAAASCPVDAIEVE